MWCRVSQFMPRTVMNNTTPPGIGNILLCPTYPLIQPLIMCSCIYLPYMVSASVFIFFFFFYIFTSLQLQGFGIFYKQITYMIWVQVSQIVIAAIKIKADIHFTGGFLSYPAESVLDSCVMI